MDVGPWDLADRTALFLGVNHSSGIADANTRRMHEALRDLVEQHDYGGSSIGGTLVRQPAFVIEMDGYRGRGRGFGSGWSGRCVGVGVARLTSAARSWRCGRR